MSALRRVLVVGSLNLDVTLELPHLPVAGATLTATAVRRSAGGKGANQAAAASSLGAAVSLLGALGDDDAARIVRESLAQRRVQLTGLFTSEQPTGTATILLTPDGENSIVLAPGANHALTAARLQAHAALFRDAAIVLTQLETPQPALEATLALAEDAGVPVMLDPAPAASLPAALLNKLAWFTPNETEAAFYASDTGARETLPSEELCQHFRRLGIHNVLLKLGARGAAMLTEDGAYLEVSAPPVDAVDSTAAGDTLNGAMAAQLAGGSTPAQALRFAVAAASLSTTRKGAMESMPSAAEVHRFLRKAGPGG